MNRKNCVSFLTCLKSKAPFVLALVAVVAANVLCGPVFAQEQNSITLEDPGIDYAGMAGDLLGMLVKPALVGIGIGLSIFAIYFGIKALRKGMSS